MELKKKKWYFHLLIILGVVAMDLFSDYVYNGLEGFLNNFELLSGLRQTITYTAFFTVYFLNFYLVCPYTLAPKHFARFTLGVFLLIITFAGIRYVLEEVVLYYFTGQHNYYEVSRQFFYYTFDNSYFAIKAILFSTLLYLFFEYLASQKRMHQLQLEHTNAELSFLKSQLEPHFLFNTLNTFYTELIDTQPKTAKDIHRLSELLRYVTYEAQKDMMPLQKELKFIEDYIYFYRKRFEDQLFLEFSVEGVIGDQTIPSLILIHFVENIFKHGLTNQKGQPAKIQIMVSKHNLTMNTENKISNADTYAHKGIGKLNLEKRLSAIYKNEYTLREDHDETKYRAFLQIPFKN